MSFIHNSDISPDEPAWSSVDKSALPTLAFADHGETEVTSSRKFPHHWVSGGTTKDEQGIWTNGTLYLHVGGWQAAINAAHGARSGQNASQDIIDHLESHRGAIDTYREHSSIEPHDAVGILARLYHVD